MTYINLLLIVAALSTAYYTINMASMLIAYWYVKNSKGFTGSVGGVVLYQENQRMKWGRLLIFAVQSAALTPLIGQMSFGTLASISVVMAVLSWQTTTTAMHDNPVTRWIHFIAAVLATCWNTYLAMQTY